MNRPLFDARLKRNNEYYDAFASKVQIRSGDRDFSKAFDLFTCNLIPGKIVLDVGCGAGSHLAIFKQKGIDAIGVEPSEQMRKLAASFGEVVNGTFESLDQLGFTEVGGVWAASSLLHVPQEEVSCVFRTVANLLPRRGPFYFTVRLGEGSKWDKWDDAQGDISRFLQLFNEDFLLEELRKAGFEISSKWVEDSYWGRPSKWLSVIALKLSL